MNDSTTLIAVAIIAFLLGVSCTLMAVGWRFRGANKNSSLRTGQKRRVRRGNDEEIRQFRMTVNAMRKLIDAERYNEAFRVARQWHFRAPQFVENYLKLHGKFDLKELPPIEYAARHLVALRDVNELRRLREELMACEELKPWQNLLADEIVAAKELERIFDLVTESPGIAQVTAARKAGAGIRRANGALHDADVRNLIQREYTGGNYKLLLQ